MFALRRLQRRLHHSGGGHSRRHRAEGQQNAFWIAMDYVDVVVHIFQTELRQYYKLEELWADAPIKRYDYEL